MASGRQGFTLPVGERALFTITSNATDEHWHRWRLSHLRDFHLLAVISAIGRCALQICAPANAMCPLSPREQQFLERLMRGEVDRILRRAPVGQIAG